MKGECPNQICWEMLHVMCPSQTHKAQLLIKGPEKSRSKETCQTQSYPNLLDDSSFSLNTQVADCGKVKFPSASSQRPVL